MGSRIEVNKAPVESSARVMETLETLMAPKKVSQCRGITTPAIIRIKIFPGEIIKDRFLYHSHNNMKPVARSIRYHTNGIASSELKAPRTAVKQIGRATSRQ